MPGLETTPEMFDLRMSEEARPLLEKVKAFVRDEVDPITRKFYELGENRAERFSWVPGQLELLDGVKAKAKASGLWNFFLPDDETGQGLSNLDYAYIAAELGKNPLASSDAKNIACQARLVGDEWVLNGEKYYISGAGDPRCKILITMVQTNPDAPPHKRQSQILVPIDTPGCEVLGPMHVFGSDDAPQGHLGLLDHGAKRKAGVDAIDAR